MESLNYTIVIVSTKSVISVWKDHCHADRESAERFAEGMISGLHLAGKRYVVIMLLDGQYDPKTTITKNMSNKHFDVFYKDYLCPLVEY